MHIGLTYNLKTDVEIKPDDPIDRAEEFDSEETIDAIDLALQSLGHTTVRLGWGAKMLATLAGITRDAPSGVDAVFNIAEGVGGRGRESQVPAILEMLGIRHTGSDPFTLAVALDKGLAKLLASSHGIPTAPFHLFSAADEASPVELNFPLFAKPAAEGSSMGIRDDSICRDQDELIRRVRQLQKDYRGSVLVEEFLPGHEFTTGVVGNGDQARVVGTMQVVPKVKTDQPFIYSLEVKRDYLRRVDYRMTDDIKRRTSPQLVESIEKLALEVHRAFGCRDVSRVDVRCDANGKPNFVEVNPLPGLNPTNSDLVIIAKGHGLSYEQLIESILAAANSRWQNGT